MEIRIEKRDRKGSLGLIGHYARDQRGAALILAIGMLVILSVLGALALSTTNSEIGISGNFRSAQEAFYAADRAVEYALVNEVIYTTIGAGSVALVDDTTTLSTNDDHESNIQAGTLTSGLSGTANSVSWVVSGPPPLGSVSDASYFHAEYYNVSVQGAGRNNSVSRIEAQVARIVPN